MPEEDASRALETLGLTGKEARAYLGLLRSGVSTAQQVSVHLWVQYPAVYRILQSLQSKGWVEVSQDRPNRYRARAPRIVAEEARQARGDNLESAAEVVGSLRETPVSKSREADTDLWIYKGADSIGRKLREVVLSSGRQILCVSPFPVAPEILRLLFDALGRSRRAVRVVLSEGNRGDLAELGGLLSRMMQVQFHFPTRPLPKTRLAHTYVLPSDEEVFILNSFYRDGDLVTDKLQGLWIGDMDFVRIQLESSHPKAFSALPLIALILGAFAFLVLQVGVPLLLGPVGILIVLCFDLGLAIEISVRKRRRRQRPRIVFGPIEKGWRVRRRDAFEREIAAGFVLGVLLLVVSASGKKKRVEFWWINQQFALYVVGTAMTTLALWVWRGIRIDSWISESEKFDTVKDH